LLIDDEEAVCWALERALKGEGHSVSVAPSAEEGFKKASARRPDAVFLDVRLPGMDGLTALGQLRRQTRDAPVIVITAFGNLDTAVKAVEGGAFDYLAKPFDLDQALDAVNRALRQTSAVAAERAPAPADAEVAGGDIVGRSLALQLVFKRIALVAPRDACVLITGESGSGKELVARAIHRHSSRKDRPFLPVHIAALNPNLVESELFGHVRGAFTGATQARPGLLSLADGGTVFLDEVADIPLPVQVKLLRVLEQNEVLPVGGTQALPLNIRILSATHQDLSKAVAEGRFRHDLFFRLNVFQIHLPPLRDRPDDIVSLAEHFLNEFTHSYGRKRKELTPEALQVLREYHWPGNVRELKNLMERIVIMNPQVRIDARHLPPLAPRKTGAERPPDHFASLHDYREAAERDYISRKLEEAGGNMTRAAELLGLERSNLYRKMKALGIAPKDSPAGA